MNDSVASTGWWHRVPTWALLTILAICVCCAVADAWSAFNLFDFAMPRVMDRGVEMWFLCGPLLFLPTAALGFIFACLSASGWSWWRGAIQNSLLILSALLLFVEACGFEIADVRGHGHQLAAHGYFVEALTTTVSMLVAAAVLYAIWRRRKTVIAPKDQPIAVSGIGRRTRAVGRVVGVGSIVLGSIAAVTASSILLFLTSCTPPSLDELARRFPAQRGDLETLIRMSDEDSQLDVIDPSWIEMKCPPPPSNELNTELCVGKQYENYSPEIGISRARYDAYMEIFKRDRITQGIRRYGTTGDALMIVKSIGMLDSGYSNGYVYCGPRPGESPYEPCRSALDADSHTAQQSGEAYSFRKVADHWYVYSQGPG